MDKKQRGINFYLLIDKIHRSEAVEPSANILQLLEEIMKLDVVDKIMDIKNDKFMYLDYADRNRQNTITMYFTSAKNQYRADLIDRRTGKKRPNPKTQTEGEQQKTHMTIKVATSEVKVVLEKNGNGVSINQITGYLNYLTRQLFDDVNYSISYDHIMRTDFLERINALSRIYLAELHVTKSILGDAMLDYSNRTTDIKSDVIIKVQPRRGQTLKNAALDFFTSVQTGRRAPISRLTLKGKDDHKNDVTLDTLDFIMKDSAWFDTRQNGEVETERAFTILKGYLNTF